MTRATSAQPTMYANTGGAAEDGAGPTDRPTVCGRARQPRHGWFTEAAHYRLHGYLRGRLAHGVDFFSNRREMDALSALVAERKFPATTHSPRARAARGGRGRTAAAAAPSSAVLSDLGLDGHPERTVTALAALEAHAQQHGTCPPPPPGGTFQTGAQRGPHAAGALPMGLAGEDEEAFALLDDDPNDHGDNDDTGTAAARST
jgi:hypothetical protein